MNTNRLFAGAAISAVLAIYNPAYGQVLGGNIGGAVNGSLSGGLHGVGGLDGIGRGGLGDIARPVEGVVDTTQRTTGKVKAKAEQTKDKATSAPGAVEGAVNHSADAAGSVGSTANATASTAVQAAGNVSAPSLPSVPATPEVPALPSAPAVPSVPQVPVDGSSNGAANLSGSLDNKEAKALVRNSGSSSIDASTPKLNAAAQASHSSETGVAVGGKK